MNSDCEWSQLSEMHELFCRCSLAMPSHTLHAVHETVGHHSTCGVTKIIDCNVGNSSYLQYTFSILCFMGAGFFSDFAESIK